MDLIYSFFKNRCAGFYVGAVGALLSLIASIVYIATFSNSNNPYIIMHLDVFIFLLLAFVAFVALGLFDITNQYAPIGLFVLQFVAFFQFVSKSYMYFSEVFFGVSDIGGAMSALFTMHGGFLFTVIAFILVAILSVVAIFMKQAKAKKEMEAAK